MKQNYFKHMLLALLLLCSTVASARVFEVDGIFYNITNEAEKTVKVTYKGSSSYDYNEYSGTVNIPATVVYSGVTYNVTSIGNEAFYYCENLTSVTIPNSVTSIGDKAFYCCYSFKEVHITDLAAWCRISFGSSSANPLYNAHYLYSVSYTHLTLPTTWPV